MTLDTRALQSAIDTSREAALVMNEAWCADGAYERACKLLEAEEALLSALKALRSVRTPIAAEPKPFAFFAAIREVGAAPVKLGEAA